MIVTWPDANGGLMRVAVERLTFCTVGISVFLVGGDTFPLAMPFDSVAKVRDGYLRGTIEVMNLPACPLFPPITVH